jgi:transcriptional regulator with XRE-family HTH domain
MDNLDSRLGSMIRQERETRGWSLTELASRSGVSRAMINKVERGESSPTAALLGRLSGAFGLTLSTLLARTETGTTGRLVRRDAQPTWRDPATGYLRRQVAPVAGSRLPLDLVQVELPPGAAVVFPAAAYTFSHQVIWILSGALTLIEGGVQHHLEIGDCLEFGAPSDCTFRNDQGTPCLYAVVLMRNS